MSERDSECPDCNESSRKLMATAALAAVASWAVGTLAVPNSLVQQGRLFDSEDNPVSGSISIVFTLYDDPTESDDALWTETQDITLEDGYFSARLGDVTALDPGVFDGSVRYLGVKVGSDPEMTPRQAITSVPYAIKAGHALEADEATHASEADNATNADHATTADSATNASSAAVAQSVAFGNITSFPGLCATGSYLRGFASGGVAQCSTPTLSCTQRTGDSTTGTLATVNCNAGEAMTGGGCTIGTGNSLEQSARLINAWLCQRSGTNGNLVAYAECCTITN